MEAQNKFARAVNKKIAGLSYKLHSDSITTITHPSLNELGRQFHWNWFGVGFRGVLPRRRQLIDLANELLNHVAAPSELALPPDIQRVDPALLEYAQKLTDEALDRKTCLIGSALCNALRIIDENQKVDEVHYLGAYVYVPLLILEGILMEPRTRRASAKPRMPAVTVVRADYAAYVKAHGGSDLNWPTHASSKYNVTYGHVVRTWAKMKKTA